MNSLLDKHLASDNTLARSIFELSSDIVIILAEDKIAYANPTFKSTLLKKDSQPFLGQSIFEFIEEHSLPAFKEFLAGFTQCHGAITESIDGIRFLDHNRNYTVYAGIVDILGHRHIQLFVKKNYLQLGELLLNVDEFDFVKDLFSKNEDALLLVEVETRLIKNCNEKSLELFGYDNKAELLNQGFDWFLQEHFEDEERHGSELLSENSNHGVERLSLVSPEGDRFWIELSLELLEFNQTSYRLARIKDISEQRQLVEDNLFFKGIFNQANDIILVLNEGGQVIYINESGLNSLKLPAQALAELTIQDIEQSFQSSGAWAQCVTRTKSSDSLRFEGIHQRFDKTQYPVEASLTYMRINDRGFLTLIARDITKRRQFERQLKQAKREAESASKAKDQFLSIMSHELRTPMNAVIGLTHLLRDEDPKPSQLEYLDSLGYSANNLLSIINDILDFSKIEAQKVDLEERSFNLRAELDALVAPMKLMAEGKEIDLKVRVDDNVPSQIVSDRLRLSQILTNLLNNAIKFTERGLVEFQVAKGDETSTSVELIFRVIDTGIGIEPDSIPIILDYFSQANTNTTRKYGGSGLGLAITQKLLSLFNSELTIKSRPGHGSEFAFKVQLKTGADPRLKDGEYQFSHWPGSRILLVEDNPVNQKVALRFLEKWKLEVDLASNGLIARDKANQGEYGLILMDLQMPEMDGYEATRQIRRFDKDTPIIALTAAALLDVRNKVLEVGMQDMLMKPFHPADLNALIASYILPVPAQAG